MSDREFDLSPDHPRAWAVRASAGMSQREELPADVARSGTDDLHLARPRHTAKRVADVFLTTLAVVVLGPLMLVIAAAIRLESKGPVLFRQRRVGRDRKLFEIYKFRTMSVDAPRDVPTHLLTSPEKHITRVGMFLRRSSLDELPQLLNVLRGEMSLVGPRPALWNQMDLVEGREAYGVNALLPGVTGWAQVNGRDEHSIPEKAKLDAEYLARQGLAMDLRCLFLTVLRVVDGKGRVEGAQA